VPAGRARLRSTPEPLTPHTPCPPHPPIPHPQPCGAGSPRSDPGDRPPSPAPSPPRWPPSASTARARITSPPPATARAPPSSRPSLLRRWLSRTAASCPTRPFRSVERSSGPTLTRASSTDPRSTVATGDRHSGPRDRGAESARSEADRRLLDDGERRGTGAVGRREHLVRRALRPFQPERSREATGASQRPRPALRARHHRDRTARRQIPQGVQPPPPGSRPRPFCDRGHSPAQQNPNPPRRPKDTH
jgi:hypothetical protein